jgi:heat shock protein beta
MAKTAEEEPERYAEILKVYNGALKIGVVETGMEGKSSNRDKLTALTRWDTNLRTEISIQDYIESRREGQDQIYFLVENGQTIDNLRRSVFVEKLVARGYEVILMTNVMCVSPSCHPFLSNLFYVQGRNHRFPFTLFRWHEIPRCHQEGSPVR